jgi:[NiFe] hydrogenase diaphorase moiety large subunit
MLVNDQVFTKVTPQKVHDILQACETVFGPHFSQLDGVRSEREGDIPASRHRSMTLASVEPDAGLAEALKLNPQEVIQAVCDSGMKGRGGAGFPTGLKWRLASELQSDRKYVICNADEGEPGTFKDRVILSEWADLVFEGMTIAGYAIGADSGILYLRGEYEYLRKGLESCLARRRREGLLGENLHDKSGFNFDVHIHMGCGAYICGEETALIESLEGHRGEARNRPPFPVNTGFNGRPTIVNNVETFAWASAILSKGAEWFCRIGTEKSTGPKLFSVSGDIERPGVYEFPFGISIEALLAEVGGSDAKAVIIGGASGICIPAHEFKRGISYEEVSTGGSVIVFGAHRNMLDVAENFLEFFAGESCGQCTPCRIGNTKLLEGVRKLKKGECSTNYLSELLQLGETMQIASKCGLGQSSPNAFLSIIKHFRHEIMGREMAMA